jgi:hypothetical protein
VLRLVAASGVLLLGACSGDRGSPAPGDPTATEDGATESSTEDEILLEQVRSALSRLLGQSRGVTRTRPGRQLAETLDRLNSRLVARLDAVDAGDVPVESSRTAGSGVVELWTAVLAAQQDVDRLAARADSGDLARLLASIGAGLQQDAAALAPSGTPGSRNAARAGLTSSIGRDLGEPSVLDAVQQVLAGEHAAVYAYGVIGGRGPAAEAGLGRRAYVVHRARRDTLTTAIRALEAEPAVAEPGYALPVDVASATAAQRVGQQVEDRCSVLYAALVAAAPGSGRTREQAVTALGDAAVRLLAWGGQPVALPGVQLP